MGLLAALLVDPPFATREIIDMLLDQLRQDPRAVVLDATKHLRSNPDDPAALGRRGLTQLLMGSPAGLAEPDLQHLVRLLPDFRPCLEPLAVRAMNVATLYRP